MDTVHTPLQVVASRLTPAHHQIVQLNLSSVAVKALMAHLAAARRATLA